MMMGELDYSGFRDKAGYLSSDMEGLAITVFIIFCITMSLVVNNLLVGEKKTSTQYMLRLELQAYKPKMISLYCFSFLRLAWQSVI